MKMNTLFASYIKPRKVLRKNEILEEMKAIVPRETLAWIINDKLPKQSTGRPRTDTVILLKIIFLQYLFGLADETVEEDIYDRSTFRWFLGEEYLVHKGIPDATTLCKFRAFLNENNLQNILFFEVKRMMDEKWLILKTWTIVDATIISAPSSTKNKEKQRDSDMKSTKKGNNYSFWMKTHIGTDMQTWLVHSVEHTSANVHDSQKTKDLLHGEEGIICWDKWYADSKLKKECRENWLIYAILDKGTRGRRLSNAQIKRNKKRQSIKAKVERPFWVFKKWWWLRKTRYRWLQKNGNWITLGMAFVNFFLGKWYCERQWLSF